MNIKTPANDVVPSKENPKTGPGKQNGEPGFLGRTPSPNAKPERTYDGAIPSGGNIGIKTPGETSKKL